MASTPSEVLEAFRKAAKAQDFEEAWKHTAQYSDASEEVVGYLRSRVQRLLKIAAEGWDFEIVEEKILSDGAVIVLHELKAGNPKALNLDPAFLIKQNGQWKLFQTPTEWEPSKRIPNDKQPASMRMDEKTVATYQELEKWFEERAEALKDQAREKPAKGKR